MNPFAILPRLTYFCFWPRRARTKPRKGRKKVTFSDRYQFDGNAVIEQVVYRVAFVTYEDVFRLMAGEFTCKTSMVELYAAYEEALALQEQTYFSPIIQAEPGCIGSPAVIEKGGMVWLPYLTVDLVAKGKIMVECRAIEATTGDVVKIAKLGTKPREIVRRRDAKTRYVYKEEGATHPHADEFPPPLAA